MDMLALLICHTVTVGILLFFKAPFDVALITYSMFSIAFVLLVWYSCEELEIPNTIEVVEEIYDNSPEKFKGICTFLYLFLSGLVFFPFMFLSALGMDPE